MTTETKVMPRKPSDAVDSSSTHPTRRDFLYIATATVGAVGAIAASWPLIDQMNPDASTLAAGGPVDFDVGKLVTGQQAVVRWRSRPAFVVHRTPTMLAVLQEAQLTQQLADPQSKELQQPPYADNWHRSVKPEYGVLVGISTHLGCIPKFEPAPDATQPARHWPGGYFCPCHGSKYDLAGRVFSGVPAPYNPGTALSFCQQDRDSNRREPGSVELRFRFDPPNLMFREETPRAFATSQRGRACPISVSQTRAKHLRDGQQPQWQLSWSRWGCC